MRAVASGHVAKSRCAEECVPGCLPPEIDRHLPISSARNCCNTFMKQSSAAEAMTYFARVPKMARTPRKWYFSVALEWASRTIGNCRRLLVNEQGVGRTKPHDAARVTRTYGFESGGTSQPRMCSCFFCGSVLLMKESNRGIENSPRSMFDVMKTEK